MPIDPTLIPETLIQNAKFDLNNEDLVDFKWVSLFANEGQGLQIWEVDLGFPYGLPEEHTIPVTVTIPVKGQVAIPDVGEFAPDFLACEIQWDQEFLSYSNDQYTTSLGTLAQHASGANHRSVLKIHDLDNTWELPFFYQSGSGVSYHETGAPQSVVKSRGFVDDTLRWTDHPPSLLNAVNKWIQKNQGKNAKYVGTLQITFFVTGWYPIVPWDENIPAWNRFPLSTTDNQGRPLFPPEFFQHAGKTYIKIRGLFVFDTKKSFDSQYPPAGSFPPNGYLYQCTRSYKFTITDTIISWGFPIPEQLLEANVWNLEDDLGRIHETFIGSHTTDTLGQVYYRRSASPVPGWLFVDLIDGTLGAEDPRMVRNSQGRLYLTYAVKVGGAYISYRIHSDDDGVSWLSDKFDTTMPGKHPTISIGRDDTIVQLAIAGGVLTGTIQRPGDTKPSDVFTCKDKNDKSIEVADDSFHLMQARRGSREWYLSIILKDDTTVTNMWSTDDGRTWNPIK